MRTLATRSSNCERNDSSDAPGIDLRDADAAVVQLHAEALQQAVPERQIHVRTHRRIQEIARRVFSQGLLVVAELHDAAGDQSHLQSRVRGAHRLDQRVGLAQYGVGLRLRQVRLRDGALQHRIEVRRDRADLLNRRVRRSPPPPPPPPPPPNPALCALPFTPTPAFTLEICELALGTPRIGPPACARSKADCASNGP